jgi:preprotein translocase subunit YajC
MGSTTTVAILAVAAVALFLIYENQQQQQQTQTALLYKLASSGPTVIQTGGSSNPLASLASLAAPIIAAL